MTHDDAAYSELPAASEQALDVAKRSLTIAREVIDAQQDGPPLPSAVVIAYSASIAQDEDTLQRLRSKAAELKGWIARIYGRGILGRGDPRIG